MRRRPLHVLLTVALGIAAFGWAEVDRSVAGPSFLRDVEALCAVPHRMTGSPEGQAVAEHLERRLNEMGADWVVVQPFSTLRLETRRCEARLADGRTLRLFPLRPNGVLPPVTPPEGLRGRIVHVGGGSADEFAQKDVRDAIVVMELYGSDGWLRAFRLGARAVVFVPGRRTEATTAHHVDIPANLPRFYYPGPTADWPEDAEVTIFSEVVWRRAVGRNIIGFFRGTNPVFEQGAEEMVLLSADYDTFGTVPECSPGARKAANVAALLQLAERFAARRARRHVMVAFLDAQWNALEGSSVLYMAMENDHPRASVRRRRASLDEERKFLTELLRLIEAPAPFTTPSPARRAFLLRLQEVATEETFTVGDLMAELRRERRELRAEIGSPPRDDAPPEKIARLEEIDRLLQERWQPERDEWNDLRRALGKEELQGLSPGVEAKLRQVIGKVRERALERMHELDVEEARIRADEELQARLQIHDPAAGRRTTPYWLTLHLALMLGDSSERWGLALGGDSYFRHPDDHPGLYGRVQNVFLRAWRDLGATGVSIPSFETATVDQTLTNTRVLFPGFGGLVHGGEPAGTFGIFNAALCTVQESALRDGTPFDTPDRLDLTRIERQVEAIAQLLAGTWDAGQGTGERLEPGERTVNAGSEVVGVLDHPGLSLRRGIVGGREYAWGQFSGDMASGPIVMGMLPGSSMPDTPMVGAVVQYLNRFPTTLSFESAKPQAVSMFRLLMTDGNGGYHLGPAPGGAQWTNARGFAALFDERGELVMASNQATLGQVRQRLNVFRARPGSIVLPVSHRKVLPAGATIRLLSAFENAEPDIRKRLLLVNDGVVAWFADVREKAIKIFHLDTVTLLGIGPERMEEAGQQEQTVNWLGDGAPMVPRWQNVAPARRGAVDLWRLNESRLRILHRKNIEDNSIAELHGRVEDMLLGAQRDRPTLRSEALDTAALMVARPVYRKIRTTIDDLVFAVLILLGLAVPFAFALERVLIGAVTIYRQILWFAIFFVLTFLILFFTHPAFAIAGTPIIIFLGFAILVLSSTVISIIMRKFEVELKAMQGMTTTVHAADVSRMNTLIAAMQMGVSTMRRRPLRTALTAITIILLTFTILSFASFGTQTGLLRLFAGPVPPYAGIWIHDANWQPLAPELIDVLKGRWGDSAAVCGRWWVSPRAAAEAGGLLTRDDGTRPLEIPAVLGFDREEIRRRPDLSAVLDADLEGTVQITPAVARALGVEQGDFVRFRGRRLRVGRILDATAFSALNDMDGSSILPVDFTEVRSTQPPAVTANEEQLLHATVSWTTLPADSVVVVESGLAREMGASLHGLAIYTEDVAAAREIGAELARMLPLPIAVTMENGVFRQVLGTLVAASGAADLFFPILLGGLVIFGTMLGSVADREREIYTFSALGLAPRHVAMLFLAEAMVYSLLGGMGGYLLAQAVVRVMTALAEQGWVRVPEMNVSSTNTIVTILIVMGTVLASAVYPALKASKSANPGLMRTWRPPAPTGDRWEMVFPFTVSEYDLTGVVSFLKEHFDNHSDTGLGRFMARESELVREGHALGLKSVLMLAPFDLGVSQRFHLRSVPSEIPGIDEVHIRLERLSGQPKDWQRLNQIFLKDLRQQFLIWRSLPQETMELYRQRTLSHFGRGPSAPGKAAS